MIQVIKKHYKAVFFSNKDMQTWLSEGERPESKEFENGPIPQKISKRKKNKSPSGNLPDSKNFLTTFIEVAAAPK